MKKIEKIRKFKKRIMKKNRKNKEILGINLKE